MDIQAGSEQLEHIKAYVYSQTKSIGKCIKAGSQKVPNVGKRLYTYINDDFV